MTVAGLGLRQHTVRDAASYADACARHRWRIPADYGIAADCVDRQPPDGLALIYEDDDGRHERYTFGELAELSRRLANALPVSRLFGPEALLYRLQDSAAKVILLERESLPKLDDLREVPQPRRRHAGLRLRCIASGGEPVGAALAEWTHAELGVEFNIAYGQTEANFIIGSCGALEAPRLAALGKPYPGHVVALIDGAGQPVPDGESGEIAVRRDDPVVMREYWNNAAAMREKFTGEWCRTGDMGCRDAGGWIHFHGRGDDLIKTSGYRVGPAEVEASVMEVPGVAACAVIGVPDAERGEAIKAFVKLMPGHAPGADLARRIQAHVKSRLAAHEYPREIEFIEEFPATVTGKIRRRELREAELRKRQDPSGDGQ